jgi:hypothetical protein
MRILAGLFRWGVSAAPPVTFGSATVADRLLGNVIVSAGSFDGDVTVGDALLGDVLIGSKP